MRYLVLFMFCVGIAPSLRSQSIDKIITRKDVTRIETVLSANDMEGRKVFTSGNQKAASFIASEFKKIGLTTLPGNDGYFQSFSMVHPKLISQAATLDNISIDPKYIALISCLPAINITEQSGYQTIHITPADNFAKAVKEYLQLKENLLVIVDPKFEKYFSYLNRMGEYLFTSDKSVVFVLGTMPANQFNIQAKQEVIEQKAANVVGVIPGKSKPEEIVIFSGHYDHLGKEKQNDEDSIYNGANDDASGITAVIEIAKYYKAKKNNERSLVFAAFTAEEVGGYGSQYFSRQTEPARVVAMFNIEMIGTESKWGRNSAYITGYEKSDFGKILQNNLQGSRFTFYPDPYTKEQLFYRSDNATLARLGVPAHTISTSKMDDEPNYHKLSDEIKTLDMDNMTAIIKSIVASANSIVSGLDTPSRVQENELNR